MLNDGDEDLACYEVSIFISTPAVPYTITALNALIGN